MRKFLYLTLLLSFYSYSQKIQTEVSASELVYSSILEIESGILKGKGIADIIILAGHLKGYNGRNEDITEEWREW